MADTDDPPTPLVAHDGENSVDQTQRAEHIDVELGLSVTDSILFRRAAQGYARVVDQQIDPPGAVKHCL